MNEIEMFISKINPEEKEEENKKEVIEENVDADGYFVDNKDNIKENKKEVVEKKVKKEDTDVLNSIFKNSNYNLKEE